MTNLSNSPEEFLPIPEFNGLYLISKSGIVLSTRTGKIIKPAINQSGYFQHSFTIRPKQYTRLLHRLVAQTFLENPENLPEVNHKDANKQNPNVGNLEWVTRLQNSQHAFKLNLIPFHRKGQSGKKSVRSKPVYMCDLRGNILKEFESVNLAAIALGVDSSGIYDAIKGRYETSAGYKWKYVIDAYEPRQSKNYYGHKKSSVPVHIIGGDGEIIRYFESATDAARELNLDMSSILKVAKGLRPHHKNYRFGITASKSSARLLNR